MLILRRREGESLQIGGMFEGANTLFDQHGTPVVIEVKLVKFAVVADEQEVRIGVTCSRTVPVHRHEVIYRIRREERRLAGGEINGNVADPEAEGLTLHG